MKFYLDEPGWTERLSASATPSITLRSAVPAHLTGPAALRELARIRLCALLHRRQTPDWLHLLNSHPAFSEYVRRCPRFLFKIFRPYGSLALSPTQRLDAIRAHYVFMFRRGLGQTVARASSGPVLLAEAAGAAGAVYRIRLRTVDLCDREGELALQLASGDDVLATVAFTIAPRDGVPAVSIGCIRNGTAAYPYAAACDLGGLEPRQFLARLVRHLGYAYGCERMLMVSDRNRVVRKGLFGGRTAAGYDRLWNGLGARLRRDGDYDLPCSPERCHGLLARLADGVAAALRAQAPAV